MTPDMTTKDKRTEVINTQRLISRKGHNRQMNLAGTSGYQHTCLSQKLLAELIACSLREIGCRIQRNSSNFSPLSHLPRLSSSLRPWTWQALNYTFVPPSFPPPLSSVILYWPLHMYAHTCGTWDVSTCGTGTSMFESNRSLPYIIEMLYRVLNSGSCSGKLTDWVR